jgi:site-specific DNA-adenine methylase
MANEPIVQFYQGLQDSKERSIQTLLDRKSVIEMKNEHMK